MVNVNNKKNNVDTDFSKIILVCDSHLIVLTLEQQELAAAINNLCVFRFINNYLDSSKKSCMTGWDNLGSWIG